VNWLKAMLLMVVLGAILYGVNLVLNKTAPVESPGNNGAWTSTDGPMTPPVANHGTVGTNATPGPAPSAYSQPPAGQSAYSSANNAMPIPATGGTASVPPPASPTGYQAGVYQPASPPIVNSDPPHASIPATTVGLTTGTPSGASPAETPSSPSGSPDFATTMDGVMATLRDGKLAEGLQQLTRVYDAPQLNLDQSKQLNDLLGRLAGTVVYSRQHLLLPPYEIKPGDRLETIANQYQVPAGLLAKINGIGDPDHLTPGNQLKVIRGPFMALVSLNKREVTLVVQQCYAGRFKLTGVGRDAATLNGNFKVERKDTGNGGPTISFGGGFTFLDGSNPSATDDPRGLVLSSSDAGDLFDILSVGSTIVVR
jgi:hypothetical protein